MAPEVVVMTNVVSVGDNKVDTMDKVLVCIAHRLYDDNDSVKNQDNTYRSDVQVIVFYLKGHFRYLQVLYSK